METLHGLQRNNFFRLLRLLLDVGTEVFKEVFKKRFPPVSSYGNIIEPNRKRLERLIHGTQQRDILFPSGSKYSGDLSDLNVSTLYTLLRNIGNLCPHQNGWGKDPEKTDRSLSANIERIRNVRNIIEHLPSAALQEEKFNDLWECLRTSILELGGQNYADRIDEMLVLPVDEAAERTYLDRLESLKSENEVMIGRINKLEEITAYLGINSQSAEDDPEMKKRKDELDRFVVTNSATKAVELLRQNQVLLLRGGPGSGKSITALYAAHTLHNREKYFIHFSIEPSDILKYKNDDKKHIFIFDDVCGTVHTNQYNAERWKTYRNDVTKVLATRSTIKILLISRIQVDVSDLFMNIFGTTIKEVEAIISLPERKKIANEYLKEDDIAKLDDKTIGLFSFFPFLCVFVHNQNDPQLSVESFFKQPLKYIENELNNLHFNSKPCFIALCILVIFNNSVEKENLPNDAKDILESLVKELKVDSPITWQSLESAFQQLIGSYVVESTTSFTCLHAMFDMIAKFVGEKIPKTIFTFGHTYLLRDRVQLKTTRSEPTDQKIVLPQEFQGLYMERMVNEVQKGFYSTAFVNQMTQDKTFRSQFITYIEEHMSSIDLLFENEIEPNILVVLSGAGYMDFIFFFTAENEQLLQNKSTLEICLVVASSAGNTEVVRFLLKYEFDRDSCIRGDTALIAASVANNEGIVNLLIQKGANVNAVSMKVSALHAASLLGYFEIVRLLVTMGALINVQDVFQYTPLHFACCSGNLDIVKLLIKNHADINSKTFDRTTPIHIACYQGHTTIVKYLASHGANLFAATAMNCKSLYFAAHSNVPKIIDFLLDQGMEINDGHLTSIPPLIEACESGSTEVIKVLIKRGVNINCKDKNGSTSLFLVKGVENAKLLVSHGIDINTLNFGQYSALHVQCDSGIIDVIEYLLTLNVNINEGHLKNMTPLHVACSKGRKDVVLLLLQNSADTNLLTKDKITPLQIAILNQHFEIAEILLNQRADSFSRDANGISILCDACSSGNLSIVKRLLRENVDVNAKDGNEGAPPLIHGLVNNHKDIVQTLIDHSADLNTQFLGRTPLMISVELDKIENVEMTEMLITAGAKVNMESSDEWRCTPLHVASRFGNTRHVKLLIRNNASIDGGNSRLQTSLHLAAYYGHLDVLNVLLKYGANILVEDKEGRNALHVTANAGIITNTHETILISLIKKGIEINQKERKDGATALHLASCNGNFPLVELLINHKADIDCLDSNKCTPLRYACQNGHKTTVQLLLGHLANISIADTNGITPFHIACSTGQTDIVDLMIKHRTNIEQTTTKGYTGMYLACRFGHLKTVERLLMESKCVELIDKNHYASISAFHIACKSGHFDIVKLLAGKPINFSALSKKGRNSLHFACQSGQANLVRFLVNHQLDVNCQSVKGDTPLHWACFLGHLDIVEILLKCVIDINVGRETYFTPLHAACRLGDLDIARVLIDHSADVRTKTKSGLTVFGYACLSGNTHLINLLIKLQK